MQEVLDELVGRIVAEFGPRPVILFGRGAPCPRSWRGED